MHKHNNKSSRVVHASGYFSVQSCKCGSVIVEMGNMSYRLTDEGFVEFARTVGAAFEKITGQKADMLGVEMATANTRDWDEPASDGAEEVLN
ncbi:MAG: hypothetical protein HOK28_07585 [Deltaproteobacteria bacterium]|nr:hypothetical protein [Deltaproteobacteria bacterium]